MAGYSGYNPDYTSTARWLKRDAGLGLAVAVAAADVADEARIIVESEAYETGALAGSIEVIREDWTDRVGYAVTADDPAAAPTEFGNRHMPASEVVTFLTEAARVVGLDVREEE